jgi:hypothetical protein
VQETIQALSDCVSKRFCEQNFPTHNEKLPVEHLINAPIGLCEPLLMYFLRAVVLIVAAEVQQCLLYTALIFPDIDNLGFIPIIETWSGTKSLVRLKGQP